MVNTHKVLKFTFETENSTFDKFADYLISQQKINLKSSESKQKSSTKFLAQSCISQIIGTI